MVALDQAHRASFEFTEEGIEPRQTD